MLDGLRSFAQHMANSFMETDVVIRHKLTGEKDPDNPYGDDSLDYEPVTDSVKGWFISTLTRTLDSTGGMTVAADNDQLRLPVGTRVDTGDQVTFNGNTWTVVDSSNDETWPAMLKLQIERVGGA